MTTINHETARLRIYWHSFVKGVSQPSLPTLIIILITVIITFAAYLRFADESALAGSSYRYFMDSNFDTQTYVTHEVLNIKPTDKPVIAVLGSSVMLWCVKDMATLKQFVADDTSLAPVAYNLMTQMQTLWEVEAIIDRLPEDGHGVVVVGLNYGMLIKGPDYLKELIDQPKLGFSTPTIDGAARSAGHDVPRRTGKFSLDNSRFFLSHRIPLLVNLLSGGREYQDPFKSPFTELVQVPAIWEKEKSELPKYVENFHSNKAFNRKILDRIAERLQAKGNYSILVYQAPINPGWNNVEGGAQFFADQRKFLEDFAADYGLAFAAASDDVNFEQSHFADFAGHIRLPEIRMQCTRTLSKHLVRELTQ